jgi:glycerophosphoryl diester phosphodiesterase
MLVIAHRGSSGTAPENTLAAFRQAIRDGSSMIELDVRLSADAEWIVLHDRSVRRTTGAQGTVPHWSAPELRTLDAGSWYSPAFAGERIPMLREVVKMLPVRVGLDIEVKTDGEKRRPEVMARTLGPLALAESRRRMLLVTSFDHRFLRAFHRYYPAVPLGVLYRAVRDAGRGPTRLAKDAGAQVFLCSFVQARRRAVKTAHRNGLRYFVYGVNTARRLERMERYGVDGILTDYPAKMRGAQH